MIKRTTIITAVATALVFAPGCEGDSASSGDAAGKGAAKFVTWGEEYIEEKIPADPAGEAGFADGWEVSFEKFLVSFHEISVSSTGGKSGGASVGSKLVDHKKPGKKELFTISGAEARAYEEVSYAIKPAEMATEPVGGATAADRDFMAQNGYSVYVEGTATQGSGAKKTFKWGFKTATRYTGCEAEQDGKLEKGLVITNGNEATIELTIHGDHFFYDRLQAGSTGATPTRLRFDAIAKADTSGDGEVTLDELDAAIIDTALYNPSPFTVTTHGGFLRELVRTIGHYRGEGECAVSAL